MRGYSAPLMFWLRDVWLPRLGAVPIDEIEQALNSQEICWRGTDRERVAFGFQDDIAYTMRTDSGCQQIESAFVDPDGRYTFAQLQKNSAFSLEEFNQVFWDAIWSGSVSSDSLTPLRLGLKQKFKRPERLTQQFSRDYRTHRRIARSRKRSIWPGTWYLSRAQPESTEPLMRLENQKERARVLLDRYGVVTREIANREGAQFRWREVFQALRLMELSGEVIAGLFVSEFSGPQFARTDAIPMLGNLDVSGAFWVSAYDSVSPCGLGIDWQELPARRVGSYLGLVDGEVVCSSTAQGRKLYIFTGESDDRLHLLFAKMPSAISDEQSFAIEEINDAPARSSPYLEPILKATNGYRDHTRIHIEQRESATT